MIEIIVIESMIQLGGEVMIKFAQFLSDDTGAVTIDWVALTAGILLLGIMVVYAIFNNGVSGLVNSINDTLGSVTTNVNLGDNINCLKLGNCAEETGG